MESVEPLPVELTICLSADASKADHIAFAQCDIFEKKGCSYRARCRITRKVNYSDVSKTPSNFYYLEITSKLLQNYFGSASEMLSGTRIVITIRTKFPDSKELNFISIYLSRVN